MKKKEIIITLGIIAFVAGAYFYTKNKNTANKKAWLKHWIESGNDTLEAKQSFKQLLENMASNEIDILYNVLNQPDKSLVSLELKTKFDTISEKYNIFT